MEVDGSYLAWLRPRMAQLRPPYGNYVPTSVKSVPKLFKNVSFSQFFHQGAQIGCKSWKTGFYVFCLFTSLFGRFRLSRASQTIDIEKIYRLVSKILYFMPCGSVLNHFCVQCKNFIASASKFYRNSNEILSKFYRNSIEILSKFDWNSIGIRGCST